MSVGFDFYSDIHEEWWLKEGAQPYDYSAHQQHQLAVIGGDLTTQTEASLIELQKIAAVYETVLFIDGNHEFRMGPRHAYVYNFDFDAVEKTLRDGIAQIPNVTYLLDQPYIVDGVAFVGRNGHWDYRLFQEASYADSVDHAAKSIKSSFNEAASFTALAERDARALAKQVRDLSADDSVDRIVVMTHTVPDARLINLSDAFALTHQNRMGTQAMKQVVDENAAGKIRLWLYGHQHSARDDVLDGIRYHQNARGFPSDGQANYRPSIFKV